MFDGDGQRPIPPNLRAPDGMRLWDADSFRSDIARQDRQGEVDECPVLLTNAK